MIPFFKEKKAKKPIVIIGCGRLGSSLANDISDAGQDVIIIDKSRDAFRRLSSGFGGYTIVGDCTDFDVLQEAEPEKAGVLLAVTNDDSVNIMISEIAKSKYKIEQVIARVYDPEKSLACADYGIQILSPSVLTANAIRTLLENPSK